MLDCYSHLLARAGRGGRGVLHGRLHRRPAAARQARRRVLLVHGARRAHPYVMLNYTSRPHDVLTMAHELGHGVHATLARPQGIFHFTTPLTLAETASIFGENIVLERLLERAPGAGRAARPAGRRARRRRGRGVPPDRDEPLRGRDPHRRAASAASCPWSASASCGSPRRRDLLGDTVELDDDYAHLVVLHLALRGRARATCTRTRTATCSRCRSTGATRRRARASSTSYLDLLRAGGSRPPEELGAIVGVDLVRPRLLELGARADRAPARGGRGGRRARRGAVTTGDRRAHRAAGRRGGADAPAATPRR